MKELKNGDVFYGTHADLLNEIGLRTKRGLPFKNWYKASYEIDENTFIWIISIDGKVRGGWSNVYQGRDKIIERNPDHNVVSMGITHEYRIVFDKYTVYGENKFICKGLFKLCAGSNNQMRVLEKVADVIKL